MAFLGNDVAGFALDTFYDRRSSYQFMTTAAGGRLEGQASNDRVYNGDWNPVWEVKVGRFERGWNFPAPPLGPWGVRDGGLQRRKHIEGRENS